MGSERSGVIKSESGENNDRDVKLLQDEEEEAEIQGLWSFETRECSVREVDLFLCEAVILSCKVELLYF